MKKLSAVLMTIAAIACSSQALASYDVTLGKAVTTNGTFGTDQGSWDYYAPAAASSLTDGVFAPESEQWNLNSVWWNGSTNPDNNILIDLGGIFKISAFNVQADNNDTYRVEYRLGGGSWVTAYDIPDIASWGLTTRAVTLTTPIWADALRFTATGGDGYYSVSEVQAWGDSVNLPEPVNVGLILSGLICLALIRRNRAHH